jgi:hypothetical protein
MKKCTTNINRNMSAKVHGYNISSSRMTLCKTAHYLLNFAKSKEGQDWIDKYIHTYFSVGAPHLGAPKSMQCTIIGDKTGLDAFLSEEEALICARSFGSVPWMFPLTIPQGMSSAAYLQREGVLHVTVDRFDCYKMFSERKHMPSKLTSS